MAHGDDTWPEPAGPAYNFIPASLMPKKGLTKEQRMQDQIRILQEEGHAKLAETEKKLADTREKCSALETQMDLVSRELSRAERERTQAVTERDALRTTVEDLSRAAADAESRQAERHRLYETFKAKLQDAAGGDGSGAIAAAAALYAEYDMKDMELTVGSLAAQTAKLKAELAHYKGPLGRGKCAAQPQWDGEGGGSVAATPTPTPTPPTASNDAADVTALRAQLGKCERDLAAVVAREASLQSDLTAAQRRGIAAQRQLDELRSATAADAAGSPRENGQLTALESALDEAEAARAFAEQKLRAAVTEAARREDELAAQHAAVAADLEGVKAELVEAKESIERKVCTISELRLEVAKANGGAPHQGVDLKEARAIAECESELARARGELEHAEAEVKSLTALVRALKEEKAGSVAEVAQLKKEVHRMGLQTEVASRRHTTEVEGEKAKLHAAQLQHAEEVASLTSSYEKQLDDLAERAIEETSAAMQSLEKRVEDQTEELDSLRKTALGHDKEVHALKQESKWLQGELAKARKESTALAQRLADADADAAKAAREREEMMETLKGMKRANHRLRCEVRGESDSGSPIPLPDHKRLSVREIVGLLQGSTTTCSHMLAALEALPDSAPLSAKDEEELVFAAALTKKIHAMVASVAGEDEHPVFIAKHQQLALRVEMVREKFDL